MNEIPPLITLQQQHQIDADHYRLAEKNGARFTKHAFIDISLNFGALNAENMQLAPSVDVLFNYPALPSVLRTAPAATLRCGRSSPRSGNISIITTSNSDNSGTTGNSIRGCKGANEWCLLHLDELRNVCSKSAPPPVGLSLLVSRQAVRVRCRRVVRVVSPPLMVCWCAVCPAIGTTTAATTGCRQAAGTERKFTSTTHSSCSTTSVPDTIVYEETATAVKTELQIVAR